MEKKEYTFDEFCSIVKTLRRPEGCPWDREQSHESLKPCLLEEAYEVLDGIETLEKEGNWDSLCEELGDLLLQIVMHSRIAEEEGYFTLEDVIDGISRKMIRRHPHVFGEKRRVMAGEVPGSWEELKKKEKNPGTVQEQLEEIPPQLPALIRAQKVQKKKAYLLGDEDGREVLAEELTGLIRQVRERPADAEEGGELLWKTADLLRRDGVYAELALRNKTEEEIAGSGLDKSAKEG